MKYHCVAVLQWEAGQGGSASQFSLLSSASSLVGGEVGHLALAAFIFETSETNVDIDELIEAALRDAIKQESLVTAPFPIEGTGIQSASYLSFWGTKKFLFGADGAMHTAISSDCAALSRRKPDIVKCSKITPESYEDVANRINQLHINFGNWRPTRNCSTLVRESLDLAVSLENHRPLLRHPTVCEGLLDTPTAILDRFPSAIVIESLSQNLNHSAT
ncbi:MAG: hypothetical protein V4496_01350 [Pseudomonadota bacterium]